MARFDLVKIAKSYFQLPYPALGVFNGVAFRNTIVKTIKGIVKKNPFKSEDIFPVILAGWNIPDEPTISISGGNDIVITKLNRGSDGIANVMEEINRDNITFTMSGTIYSDDVDTYPTEAVGQLRNILVTGGVKKIECDLLTIFGISSVAIIDWKIPEGPGRLTEQDYWIKFIEDTPQEFLLVKK